MASSYSPKLASAVPLSVQAPGLVLAEKTSIEAMTSPKMLESIKKLPLTMREVIVQKLITLVKHERGYEETHPEIKKIKTLVDVDVDTYDVITEEDLMCYKTIESRFNLEEDRASMIGNTPCYIKRWARQLKMMMGKTNSNGYNCSRS